MPTDSRLASLLHQNKLKSAHKLLFALRTAEIDPQSAAQLVSICAKRKDLHHLAKTANDIISSKHALSRVALRDRAYVRSIFALHLENGDLRAANKVWKSADETIKYELLSAFLK